jgi:hypothetical protein
MTAKRMFVLVALGATFVFPACGANTPAPPAGPSTPVTVAVPLTVNDAEGVPAANVQFSSADGAVTTDSSGKVSVNVPQPAAGATTKVNVTYSSPAYVGPCDSYIAIGAAPRTDNFFLLLKKLEIDEVAWKAFALGDKSVVTNNTGLQSLIRPGGKVSWYADPNLGLKESTKSVWRERAGRRGSRRLLTPSSGSASMR